MADTLLPDRDDDLTPEPPYNPFAAAERDESPAIEGADSDLEEMPYAESTAVLTVAAAAVASQSENEDEATESATQTALARPQRAAQYRVQRRARLSTALPALLMIGLGIGLFLDGLTPELDEIPLPLLAVIALVGVGASLLWRFFLNGRRERGLLMIAFLVLGGGGGVALLQNGQISSAQAISGAIMLAGIAVIVAYIFGRGREHGNLLVGVIGLVVGAISLPLLEGQLSPEIAASITQLTPIGVIAAAALWLPRVLRPPSE